MKHSEHDRKLENWADLCLAGISRSCFSALQYVLLSTRTKRVVNSGYLKMTQTLVGILKSEKCG